MPEYVVCTNCGHTMAKNEIVDGKEVDWSNEENPLCAQCRGVRGAEPVERKRDILGGFPWKRDADGKKVPK